MQAFSVEDSQLFNSTTQTITEISEVNFEFNLKVSSNSGRKWSKRMYLKTQKQTVATRREFSVIFFFFNS